MIFNTFDETDIVSGRTTRVASGFWPGETINWSQSLFRHDFWDMTGSVATPSPSYGTSVYDVRRTMYYVNVFPNSTYKVNHDPYFSCTYGHFLGSGSFDLETGSIKCNPTKAIYNQYKNLLLGTADVDGKFSMRYGSGGTTVDAMDIFVIAFSNYKMKDRIDEGIVEFSISGANGCFTFIDDSSTETQIKNVYNIISGSLSNGIYDRGNYQGIGLFYPQNGVIILNAEYLNRVVGMKTANYTDPGVFSPSYNYNSASLGNVTTTCNHRIIADALRLAGDEGQNRPNRQMKVRKSEYVPARHYFVRVKNRDFNYSNNPTYVYDGTDGEHAKGTIYNDDFIEDPRTYPTTIGLYNDANELVAVAKLSRPAVKSFDNELLLQVRLDF